MRVIAGNMNGKKLAKYYCCFGWLVSGPTSQFGKTWPAIPFTPTSNVSVFEIRAALTWMGFNPTNQVVLRIAQDANGLPGAPIQSFVIANLPPFASCCVAAVAKDKNGVALTAGTKYWLLAGTDGTDQDFAGAWSDNSTDMRFYPLAVFFQGNWTRDNSVLPAYELRGQ